MKHLFNEQECTNIKDRINKLEPGSNGKWGKFDSHRMVCHLIDQLEYAFKINGTPHFKKEGPPMFIRTFVRLYLPFPKGKIQTDPDMLVTNPVEWEQDKERLLFLIDDFYNKRKEDDWPVHPFFGQLDGLDWAKLTRRHVDHHLRQFGV